MTGTFLTPAELADVGFAEVGRGVRVSRLAAIHVPERIHLGDLSRIDDFCFVYGEVRLGRNVHVAPHCTLAGGAAGIVLEDFSGLSYGCHVMAQSDDYTGTSLTNPTVPPRYTAVTSAPVRIGRHAILGTGTVVLPGCDVGDGSSTGANTVVTRPLAPWGIHIGAPARRIRDRSTDLLDHEAAYLAEEGAAEAKDAPETGGVGWS